MTGEQLADILKQIQQTKTKQQLEEVRVHYLGRKGLITQQLSDISNLPAKQRPGRGAELNQLKRQIETAVKQRRAELLNQQIEQEVEEWMDLSAPAGGHQPGHPHVVKELEKELVHAFWQLGFQTATGPEIESDWYNFEALNIPTGHPARDMFDTFYSEDGRVLRTHTSSVQIRHMEQHQPPVRVISIGRAYRNETEDATHLAVFRQIEGLVVDRGVSLGDLKGTLLYMFRSVLGSKAQIKLLPSYFPFVEPALEAHISCVVCGGKSLTCRTCKGVGWIEMGGAGMVHPRVLRNVNIDPDIYNGFAFGCGLERIAAIKYQIPDVRQFHKPDLRFIRQFR